MRTTRDRGGAPVRLEIADDGLPVLVDDWALEPTTLEQAIEDIRAAREERLNQLDPREDGDQDPTTI